MGKYLFDFTVVTACRNSADTLGACIESVKNQLDARVQHVVCDSVSNDATPEILAAMARPSLISIIEPDNGVYEAWNKAIAHATGEWIIFLGADDIFSSNSVLREVLWNINTRDPAKLFYGRVRKETFDGNLIGLNGDEFSTYEGQYDPPTIKLPPHPACFFHHSLFDDFPLFDEGFKICADSLHIGTILKTVTPEFLPVTVTNFRIGGLSNSRKNALLKWREKYWVTRKLDYHVPLAMLASSLLRAAINQMRG